jgi:hypothetical protein
MAQFTRAVKSWFVNLSSAIAAYRAHFVKMNTEKLGWLSLERGLVASRDP